MKKVIHPISLSFSFQDTIPSGNGYIMLDREFTNWPLFLGVIVKFYLTNQEK